MGLPAFDRLVVDQKVRQVLLNLMSNARYALNRRYPEYSDEKEIRIEAAERKDGDARRVRVTIFDNGTGIPPDAVERVFDPFFSTKPAGEGTGLGLSISYGIVRDMGGMLSVESELGAGTRLILDLPVTEEA